MAPLTSRVNWSVHEIPDYGTLRLPIPATWVQPELEVASAASATGLIFWSPDSDQLPECMIIVQFLPAPEQDRLHNLRLLAQQAIEFVRPTIADTEVALLPVLEAEEGGWYCFATAKVPPVPEVPDFNRVGHAFVLAGKAVLHLQLQAKDFGTMSKCLSVVARGTFD